MSFCDIAGIIWLYAHYVGKQNACSERGIDMKLDMMLYGLEDDASISIDGVRYGLVATGTDSDIYGVCITCDQSNGKYFLMSSESATGDAIVESEGLQELFEKIEQQHLRIAWGERRSEVDALIDEFSTSSNSADLYAEAILDLECDGEDVSAARAEFERMFGMEVEDAV